MNFPRYLNYFICFFNNIKFILKFSDEYQKLSERAPITFSNPKKMASNDFPCFFSASVILNLSGNYSNTGA